MRVLLVEDDPTTSKSIEMMLTHANLNVYTTDLGEEGVDLGKLYDYDIIVLDLNLPDMPGFDVFDIFVACTMENGLRHTGGIGRGRMSNDKELPGSH